MASDQPPSQQGKADLPAYVSELNDDDVLLGRGAPIVNNPGNLRFRALILADKERYISTSRHVIKEEIARKILNTVAERGGRFLRKLENESERRQYHVPDGQNAWVEADEATSVQKVKQALREHKSGGPRGGSEKKRKASLSKDEEAESRKRKPPPTETPVGGTRAPHATAVAVTTEGTHHMRPPPSLLATHDPAAALMPSERGHYAQGGGISSYSPMARMPMERGDYPHPQRYHYHYQFPPGPPPHHHRPPSMYPPQDLEGMDPYHNPRQLPYYSGGGGGGGGGGAASPERDAGGVRREQALYSMLDTQARAYRMASLRAAMDTGTIREGMVRPPGMFPPPQPPTAFVSPQPPYPPSHYGNRSQDPMSFSSPMPHPQQPPPPPQYHYDSSGYPVYSSHPSHEQHHQQQYEASTEESMRTHEFYLGRQRQLQQPTLSHDRALPPARPPPPQKPEDPQDDSFSPIAGRQGAEATTTTARDEDEENVAGRSLSSSPLSSASASSDRNAQSERKEG